MERVVRMPVKRYRYTNDLFLFLSYPIQVQMLEMAHNFDLQAIFEIDYDNGFILYDLLPVRHYLALWVDQHFAEYLFYQLRLSILRYIIYCNRQIQHYLNSIFWPECYCRDFLSAQHS